MYDILISIIDDNCSESYTGYNTALIYFISMLGIPINLPLF
jgi:hypothetical protein